MKYSIIIPARMNSTRLPNKMMRKLFGVPIIERTWRQAELIGQQVIVATDDISILRHMHGIGARAMLTDINHQSGTDRLSEVVLEYGFPDEHIIVNWQGDEPFLPRPLLDQVVNLLIDNPEAAMSTLAAKITDMKHFLDPNVVKVIQDLNGFALYFSRAPIPYPRDFDLNSASLPDDFQGLRHLGVYAYRAGFLKKYPTLKPVALESTEKLEQLRGLYNGYKIILDIAKVPVPVGIDTEDDLKNAELYLRDYYS
ncbi:3-deoxy-manno-octulosonate cytidylyltransferase [Gammaproteobacteria bacterium]|nr:3-deoxy-manno-octulosonate cytidylyltransferase [Gammaproteobacteria bacterium]